MPIETFNYLDSLNAANPPTSDGLVGGDDHIRGIKSALKATFPNITGPITATQTGINNAVAAVANGISLLGPFNAYNGFTSGLNFPSGAIMDLVVGGATPVRLNQNLSTQFFGPVTAPSFVGPGCVPIGSMVMWPSDILPASSYGTWVFANGQQISRSAYAEYFALVSTYYGSGNGSTTFNVPDYQEVVPVGRSQMGGAGSPGLLPSISAGIKAVVGALFGSDLRSLSTSNLPPYTPTGTVSTSTTITNHQSASPVGSGGQFTYYGPFANQGDVATSAASASTFAGDAQGGSSTPFGIAQPSRVVNFIIRVG